MTSAKKSDNGYNQRGYQFLCNLLNKKAAKSKAFDPHDFYLGVTHATVRIGFCCTEESCLECQHEHQIMR